MRTVTNRRGSVFYRCARAETDPTYARYPSLPMRACPGYEPAAPSGDTSRPSGTGGAPSN